jgi:hypothetical protein
MPSTYTPIANYTLPSAQASYVFTNIPQTYTDLVLIMWVRDTEMQQGYYRFNSDAGSNYSRTYLYGTGAARGSGGISNQTGCNTAMGDSYASITAHIMNYSSTSMYKQVIERGQDNNSVNETIYMWRSNSGITSITVDSFNGGATLATGSSFSLYGVKCA